MNKISTKVASYFSVFRDMAIRHWDVYNLGDEYIGSYNNPMDITPYGINIKTLLTVSKLMTSDHTLVSKLTPSDVEACD